MERENIFKYVGKIKSGEITRSELRELIEHCTSIALSILDRKYAKLARIFSINGYSFEDVAVDSITSLFIIHNKIEMSGIKKSIDNWKNEIATPANADFFIFTLVSKRVEQTLTKFLREIDPMFGKILKDLEYPSKVNGYKKIYYLGQVYLVEAKNPVINKELIDDANFDQIHINYLNKLKFVTEDMFNYLKNHTDFFPAIPLNLLVLRIKQAYAALLYKEPDPADIQIAYEINNALNNSLRTIFDKLNDQYVKKEILSAADGELFQKALIDIASDLKDGGIKRGLEEYLLPYYQGVSKEKLRERYHNIFDYLIRLLKKEIIKELNNTTFPN